MPEGDRELLWCHREEIGNRMVVEPQPHRIGQYELPHAVRAQRGEFSADHTTHGMAYDMYRLQVQSIEQVVVVDHHVKHVINMLNARARLKARMRRGIDRKVFGEFDQKGIPATQATSPMEKEQGRTAAVSAELGLKHTIADSDRFFLLAIPSRAVHGLQLLGESRVLLVFNPFQGGTCTWYAPNCAL